MEPFAVDPLPGHIEADSSLLFDRMRKMVDVLHPALTRYDHSEVFTRDAVLQERLASIGLTAGEVKEGSSGKREYLTLPTVQRLRDEFVRLAHEDTVSGIYYPNLHLAAGGKFKGTPFIDAYGDLDEDGLGKYIAADDLADAFGHDIAAEHLITLMARGSGRPTMQAMSRFGGVVKASASLDLPGKAYYDRPVTLTGSDKDDRGALIIDHFTQEFNNVVYDTDHPDDWSKRYNAAEVNGFVKTLREANQLEDLDVVKFMLSSGMVKSTNEITELTMLQALDSMGRNALQATEQEGVAA